MRNQGIQCTLVHLWGLRKIPRSDCSSKPSSLAALHVISATETLAPAESSRDAPHDAIRTGKAKQPDGFADRVLDHSETAHFFEVEDGSEKFCGSTSGLPLL